MKIRHFLSLICLCFFTALDSSGQIVKAVFVKLSAQTNRIRHFETKQNMSLVKELSRDAREIFRVTINDYTDHFGYCPVYYFMDTNFADINEGRWEGRLLDKELKPLPLHKIVLSPGDTNYIITYYGFPPPEITTNNNNESNYRQVRYPGEGLVVLRPDQSFMRFLYKPHIFSKSMTEYAFVSKRFDITYLPRAAMLNTMLERKDYRW